MSRIRLVGYPFFAIGIALVAIGLTGRRAFVVVGLAFLALGVITLRRS